MLNYYSDTISDFCNKHHAMIIGEISTNSRYGHIATEFQVQGLELDWTCITWDGDLRFSQDKWSTYSFKGTKWENIKKEIRKKYLINAYRVLLTRARQGMVIVVPEGNSEDHTRQPQFYNSTFNYLKEIGFEVLG